VSPTTTTGDRRWKPTQERTGSHNNNLNDEEPQGLIMKSRAGRIVLTTTATSADRKRWMPALTPDKWGKEGCYRRMAEGNTRTGEW